MTINGKVQDTKKPCTQAETQNSKVAVAEVQKAQWKIVEAPESVCSYHPNATPDSFERPADGRMLRRTKAVIMIPVAPLASVGEAQEHIKGPQKQ